MQMPQHDDKETRDTNSTCLTQKTSKRRNLWIRAGIPVLVSLLGASLLGLIVFRIVNNNMSRTNTLEKPISVVLNLADHHILTSVTINGDDVYAVDKQGQRYHALKEDNQSLTDTFRHDGVAVSVNNGSQDQLTQLLVDILFLAVVAGVVVFFFRRSSMSGQAGVFARSKARRFGETHPSVLFHDVAGVEEAKAEL